MTSRNKRELDTVFDTRHELGEGIIWDEETEQLIWFDINNHQLFLGSPESRTYKQVQFDEPVAAGFLAPQSQLLVASASGLICYDRQTGSTAPYLAIEADKPATRSNDSRTGPANSIWFGTMGRKLEAGAGCVYHVRNRQITPLFPATSIPNATCFSQDGRLAYLADTPTRAIYKIALDEETGLPAGEKELFVDLAPEGLNPDGAVLDSAGRVWNAQWGAGRIACYDETGRFVEAVHLPASQITCPCFGGPDLKTLYATSAYEGLSASEMADQPEAGAVFAIEMDIAGLPERRLGTL